MHFYNIKLYLQDHFIGRLLGLAVFIQIFMWWYILSSVHPGGEQVFLHYNIVFGIDLIGNWQKLLYLPLGGLLILLVNYLVSWLFYSQDKFLARLLSVWSVLAQLFLALAVWLIVGLNM
ncbi:MAG: hypothetical protein A2538_04785 [Candidatus Magasanikbacteria bacterium RIFOXYD2_FULL_41_14]|uniref:Uncharacterized protein n=1 Tax=Candidatus Magasanikbacteria bacterium RIFOXYD2_FULL_41_14 TaxID=1798709 RepID=A0A1F6PFM5_9BACT|nr:MAG: hypothetical protein A2538_04785 [Candidatus Magasanikbacteria bacterium RIFOXYD2_FULL_41_14]